MSWALFLDRPWVQKKHILLVVTGVGLAVSLNGYSEVLMISSALFALAIFVWIPGQIRYEQVKTATALLTLAQTEERSLSEEELVVIVGAIEGSGRREFRREIQPILEELYPDDPKILELTEAMEQVSRGPARRNAKDRLMVRFNAYFIEQRQARGRELANQRRVRSEERHKAEKADREARYQAKIAPDS